MLTLIDAGCDGGDPTTAVRYNVNKIYLFQVRLRYQRSWSRNRKGLPLRWRRRELRLQS
jgi:hypothetical protein